MCSLFPGCLTIVLTSHKADGLIPCSTSLVSSERGREGRKLLLSLAVKESISR